MFICSSVKTNGINFLGKTNCVFSVLTLYNMPSSLFISNFSKSIKKLLFIVKCGTFVLQINQCENDIIFTLPLLKSVTVSDCLGLPPVHNSSVSKSALVMYTLDSLVLPFCA